MVDFVISFLKNVIIDFRDCRHFFAERLRSRARLAASPCNALLNAIFAYSFCRSPFRSLITQFAAVLAKDGDNLGVFATQGKVQRCFSL